MQPLRSATTVLVAFFLAGCGGAAPSTSLQANALDAGGIGANAVASPPPLVRKGPKPRGWISSAYRHGYVAYVADDNAIKIYPQEGVHRKPVGEITEGVESAYGLYVDGRRNLYVCNQYENSVEVYPLGSTAPSKTYTQDLARPLYPIVDASGDLFVGNANNGTVVEYPAGKKKPSEVLQTEGTEADGMDFDSSGNLYVAYRSYYDTGGVEVFPKGSTQGHDLGIQLNQPQGLIVANDGTLLIVETGYASRIDVFPPGSTQPSFELSVPHTPTQIAITQPEHHLRVSTLAGDVYSIRYPFAGSSGPPLRERIKTGDSYYVQGLALSNGQYF
ncbi:MAG TPA: hypothetical protein VGI19_03635 [Candidatus Cybelea sp.]|jgi:hypothetical protein